MSRPIPAVPSRRYSSYLILGLVVALLSCPSSAYARMAFSQPLLAQLDFDEASFADVEQTSAGLFSMDSLLVKVLIIFFAFLFSTGLCMLIIFPGLLSKTKPTWPRTAYGYCLAIVVTATFAAVAVMLRNDLGLAAPEAASWFSKWGGLTILSVVWLFCVSMALCVRSPRRA